jgi:hypothetical protein
MRLIGHAAAFAVLAIAAAPEPAAAVRGFLEGSRLAGVYDAEYKRRGWEDDTYRIRSRCGRGACHAYLKTELGLRGVLRYSRTFDEYTATFRTRRVGCTVTNLITGEQREISKAYAVRRSVTIDRFSGGGGAARFARGTFEVYYQSTRRGERAGCYREDQDRTVVRLRRR